MKKLIATLALGFLALAPALVFAQDAPRGLKGAVNALQDTGQKGYGIDKAAIEGEYSAESVAGKIVNVLFSVLGIVFLVLMLYGGYIWMNARGDTEKVTKAKDLIAQAIIGLAIMLLAYVITEFVIKNLYTRAGISG